MLFGQSEPFAQKRRARQSRPIRLHFYRPYRMVKAIRGIDGSGSGIRWARKISLRTDFDPQHPAAAEYVLGPID